MTKLTAFVLSLICIPVCAQELFLYPRTVVAPRGSYQTVTALISGVNDKTVTWSSSGGKLVGKNPCIANEPCTIGLYSATAATIHLSAMSNANHEIVAASTVTFVDAPTPRTDHPRFLITSPMLKGLRAKTGATSPMYAALKNQATTAYNRDTAIWSWSCKGGSGQPNADQSKTQMEEGDFYSFAIMSLIAPTQTERDQWGCYGHDVFLTFAKYVINGQVSLLQGNEWSDGAIQITLTPDWLMGGGYLSSAADLNTTRAYLAKIAYEQINDTYNGMLAIIGSYNSPTQLDEANEGASTEMRAMGNNYTQSRILYMTAVALTFNDNSTDDPPLANSCNATRYQVCPDGTAGSLHAYWTYLTGGMLYKDWANMEDGSVVQPAYNAAFGNLPTQPMCNTLWHTPIPCLGQARGGESSEGTSYGTSLVRLRWTMNAIHTAGYDDPMLYGPQMSIATSSYWDLRYIADLNLLTGMSGVANDKAHWNFLSDGDTYMYFAYPDVYASEAAELTADSYVGRTDRANALKWLVMTTSPGTATGTVGNCPYYCGFDGVLGTGFGSTIMLDSFIALPSTDPMAALPTDPRPSMPTDWYAAGNQHIVTRDNWTTGNNTIFSYYCNNAQIDHEHEFCGGFSLYSKGEYITKGRTSFNDYIYEYAASLNQNLPGFINTPNDTSCTYTNGCQYADSTQLGGQFWHGLQAGWVNLQHSELPGYVAAIADDTNSYNGSWGGFGDLNGINHASRSLLYLRGSNQVITYDRGDSGANAWDKANYFVSTGPPTFAGNTASWLTRSGNQKVYWTSVMPAVTPTLDSTFAGTSHTADDWEISARMKVDAGNTASARFMSVLQWGSAGFSGSGASLVKSTSGTSFDGALIGASLVMFMHDWPSSFTSVTYPASGATTQYISDLSPNTTYAVSGTGAPASATTDNAGVLTFTATGTGAITIGGSGVASSLKGITVSPLTSTVQAKSTQQYAATCSYTDGSTADCTSSVTWGSASTSVATVNASGLASGVAQGSTNITAASGSIQGQASITVPAATLQSINVSPNTAAISVGDTRQLKATGVFSDSSTADMTSSVNWSSSNSAVVSATQAGVACGLSQGSANVLAISGNIQGQASISVVQAAPPVFSPVAGTYTSSQTVTISTTTPAATISYTTNGTTPTTSAAVYVGPLSVSSSETIQAIAVATGSSTSSVASATYTIKPQAAAAVFSPAGGTFTSAQSVQITSSTPSAVIYYTTDGTMPTTSSPVYGGPITVSGSETVRALVAANGYSSSAVSSAAYTINQQTASTPTFSPAAGSYSSAQSVSITSATPGSVIYYTTNGSTPTNASAVYSGPITVSSSETLEAITVANGYSTSTVGSATYAIPATAAAAPTFSPSAGRYSSAQAVTITTTTPWARMYYTTDGTKPTSSSRLYTGPIEVSGSVTIRAFAASTGATSSSVSSAKYTINLPVVAAPTFSVGGGKYKAAQTVGISTSTPGATIYFTTDGSTPTTNSTVYSSPLTVSISETVKAIAIEAGYSPSSVSSASFTINVATPAFSVKVSSDSVTVVHGHASLTNVTIVPENGFAAPVELSCSGLPAGARCSFSPATVTPLGAPALTVLTVTASDELASNSREPISGLPGAASMGLLGFCSFGRKRRKGYKLVSISLAGVLGLCFFTGCGTQANYAVDATSVVTVVAAHDSMQPSTTFNLTLL